jgi:hypothetical protein
MPWITKVHRCATPTPPPPQLDAGSVWQCGDVSADPESNCGRRWELQHDQDTDVLVYVEIESP